MDSEFLSFLAELYLIQVGFPKRAGLRILRDANSQPDEDFHPAVHRSWKFTIWENSSANLYDWKQFDKSFWNSRHRTFTPYWNCNQKVILFVHKGPFFDTHLLESEKG